MWWTAAAIAVLLAAALHVYVGLDAHAPRTPWDENHLLQMARLISGDSNVSPLHGAGYFPGWAIMMTPIWWITNDPATVYAIAIAYGNVIAMATIVPLAIIARRIGLTTPQAITVAALAMSLPGRTVNAEYVLAEQPLMFFLAWVVVAAIAVWENPTWGRTTLLALAASTTYLVHTRALVVVLVVAIWLIFLMILRRRVLSPLIGLATLVVSTLIVRAIASTLLERVLLGSFAQGDFLSGSIGRSTIGSVLRVSLGQIWAQFVGTAGLFAIGIVVLVVWVWRELRVRQIGVGSFLLGLTFATVVVSILSWSGTQHLLPLETARFDANVYTRYIDPVATLIVVVALAALLRRASAALVAVSLSFATLVSLPVVFWIGTTAPLWGSLDGPANSAAILSWQFMFGTGQPFDTPLIPTLTNENRFWLLASVFVVICIAAQFVLRLYPRVLVAVGAILASLLSWEANPDLYRDYPRNITAAVERIEELQPGDELVTLNIDLGCRGPAITYGQVINWLPYWLTPREVAMIDLDAGETFTSDLVVSCGTWPRADELDARRLDGRDDYTYRIWVLPGPLQDRLDEEGLLEE